MSFRLAVSLTLIVVAVFSFAYPGAPTAFASASQAGGESPLARLMGDLEQSMRKLSDQVGDAATMGDALDEVCRLQKVAIDAKNELPPSVSSIEDEKKREKARVEYRLGVQSVVRALLDIEVGILERDPKKANKALRELDKAKDAGHSRFRPRD